MAIRGGLPHSECAIAALAPDWLAEAVPVRASFRPAGAAAPRESPQDLLELPKQSRGRLIFCAFNSLFVSVIGARR